MEQKTKKKLRIIIPIIAIILVVAVIGVFFGSKKTKNNGSNPNEAGNVSDNITKIEYEINKAVLNQTYDNRFNGNYSFLEVQASSLTYNPGLTEEQHKLIWKKYGNGALSEGIFIANLYQEKMLNVEKEYVSLFNGKFIKQNSDKSKNIGVFYGTVDKSLVYLECQNGNVTIDNKNYKQGMEISLTGYGITNNNDLNQSSNYSKLYLTEHVYSMVDSSVELFSITYVYEFKQIRTESPIPDFYI